MKIAINIYSNDLLIVSLDSNNGRMIEILDFSLIQTH